MTETTAAMAVPTIDEGDGPARAVAGRLLAQAGGASTAAIAQSTLAQATGLTVKTVQRALARLLKAGWIERVEDATPSAPASYDVTLLGAVGIVPAPDGAPGWVRVLSEGEARSPLGAVTPGERVMVAPALLEAGSNVRRDLRLDDDFVATIAELGVLKDLHAYPTLTGLVVLDGHRRLEAALRVGLEAVPVLIVQVDDEPTRIVHQLVENDEHAHTLPVERAAAVQQLVLLGMPRKDLRRRGVRPAEVEAAQHVTAAPEEVRDLGRRHPDMDLLTLGKVAALADLVTDGDELAAVIEEIEDRPEYVDHTVARVRDKALSEAARQDLVDELASKGVRVIDSSNVYARSSRVERLGDLVDEHGDVLTVEAHASCPGHVAWVARDYTGDGLDEPRFHVIDYGCDGWATHGHRNRWALPSSGATSGPQEEDVKAERTRVRENNAAMESANGVRREWIRDVLLSRTRVPSDAATYELRVMRWALTNVTGFTRDKGLDRLGVASDELVAPSTTVAAEKGLLTLALACAEGSIERDSWRSDNGLGETFRGAIGDHLRILRSWGYVLSDVEKLLTDEGDESDERDE